MRRGLILAWFAGIGIVTWREVSCGKRPPVPGVLAGVSGYFALLALVAELPGAAGAAAALGWGTDLAGLLCALGGTSASAAPCKAILGNTACGTSTGSAAAAGQGGGIFTGAPPPPLTTP